MDLNGDGIDDLTSGDYTPGDVYFFEGSKGGFKERVAISEEGRDVNDMNRWMSVAHFADLDGDKDLDLVVGSVMGGVYVNKNIGTAKAFKFGKREPMKLTDGQPMKVPHKSAPLVVDWDGDALQDILVGDEDAKITFFKGRKDGTFESGVNAIPGLEKVVPGFRLRLAVNDWNEDGKLDLLVGNCTYEKDVFSGNVYVLLRK